MATLTDARNKWIADTPQGELSNADYAAMADSMAPAVLVELNRFETEAVSTDLRKKYLAGQAMMDAILALPAVPAGTLTTAQLSNVARTTDGAIRDLARFNKGLLDSLKAARVLLD